MRTLGYICLLCSVSALAQVNPPTNDTPRFIAKAQEEIAARFRQADADGDGRLTRREAQDKMPRIYQAFAAIDKEGRSYITLEQIKAFAIEQMSERRSVRSN